MRKAKASPPTGRFQPPALRVDAEKFPNLKANPALERALRIRQELAKGLPREEAVALADEAMGRISKAERVAAGRPIPVGRPANGPRPGGKAATSPRKAASSTSAQKRPR
jgi:hypothetical protein